MRQSLRRLASLLESTSPVQALHNAEASHLSLTCRVDGDRTTLDKNYGTGHIVNRVECHEGARAMRVNRPTPGRSRGGLAEQISIESAWLLPYTRRLNHCRCDRLPLWPFCAARLVNWRSRRHVAVVRSVWGDNDTMQSNAARSLVEAAWPSESFSAMPSLGAEDSRGMTGLRKTTRSTTEYVVADQTCDYRYVAELVSQANMVGKALNVGLPDGRLAPTCPQSEPVASALDERRSSLVQRADSLRFTQSRKEKKKTDWSTSAAIMRIQLSSWPSTLRRIGGRQVHRACVKRQRTQVSGPLDPMAGTRLRD